jgi:predicted amidohydrolase
VVCEVRSDATADNSPRLCFEPRRCYCPSVALIIAVAQPPCAPYDVARNALIHAAAVRAAAARVVVFPELSLTGYELDAPAIAPDDPRLRPLVEACAETRSVALVGAPLRGEGDRTHIATLAVRASGVSVAYRKQWVATTETRFTPGDDPAVIEVDGFRLGLAICKDIWVPQHAADTVALGIDAYVAGVLNSVEESSLQSKRARRIARDHNVWVALASFAGSTGGGYSESAGRSGIWMPDGNVIAQAGPETGAITRATLRPRVAASRARGLLN